MKYIDVEKLKAEIKRRHDYENEMYHKTKPDGRPNEGWAESLAIMGVLEELLFFLDTLEEPEESDLQDAEVIFSGHALHTDVTKWADGYKLKIRIYDDN